jgi:hypothetical protein
VHVPYRNSLMTLVLRDSLGGNCKTVMVATISGDAGQMEESISTCRFAQRVALVTNEVCVVSKWLSVACKLDKLAASAAACWGLHHAVLPVQSEPGNDAESQLEGTRLVRCNACHMCIVVPAQVSVNESLDPAIIIARLKQEVRDLKEEVALLKGSNPQRGPLTPDELLRLRQQLLAFVDEAQAGAPASEGSGAAGSSSGGLNFGGDMMMIRASEWWSFLPSVCLLCHYDA